MANVTGGRAVVESLIAQGVDTVFGLISTHMMSVYDALYDVRDRVRFFGGRHEQAITYAADGYARVTGKPGVCLSSTGPGAANTLGAMGEAYAGSSPVLQVTSNVEVDFIDRSLGVLHEPKDQLGMFHSVTDWNVLCRSVEEIPRAVFEAFERFKTRRPRPIEVEIATDVLHSTGDAEILSAQDYPRRTGASQAIEQALRILASAQRPVIWAGGGVLSADASPELLGLAELLDAPVITTYAGKGAFPNDHHLSLGCVQGGARTPYGPNPTHEFLAACDALLVLGSRLPYRWTRGAGIKFPEAVIHVDIDPSVFNKNLPASVMVHGDVKAVGQQLLAALRGRTLNKPEGYLREVREVRSKVRQGLEQRGPNQQRTMDALRGAIPRDTIVAVDATVPAYWAVQGFPVYEPRTYLSPHGWTGIGFGFPAALGAKVGRPDKKVVLISGDGGFQLNLQELGTVAQYGIPIVATVWNDNAWGVLKEQQRDRYQGRYFATDLHNPNFTKLADAYGLAATRVSTLAALVSTLEGALARDEFHLIEVQMPQGFANFR